MKIAARREWHPLPNYSVDNLPDTMTVPKILARYSYTNKPSYRIGSTTTAI
jgi:hypothetical protein